MFSIVKAIASDSTLLEQIGKRSLLESHGHSANKADMDAYVAKNYCEAFFWDELKDAKNNYHILYYGEVPAGYSKIIIDYPQPDIHLQNVTKLERLYLLQEFYKMKLGQLLLNFNIALSKNNNQSGMWLYVWKENLRAFNFYIRNGFRIIGNYDFKISETHSNPNHIMFLEF